MDTFAPQLLAVWQEASRQVELGSALQRLVPLIRRWLPVQDLLVRHIEMGRPVETAGCGGGLPDALPLQWRTPVTDEQSAALLQWCRVGETWHGDWQVTRQTHPGLLSEGVGGDVLAVPLSTLDDGADVLLFTTREPQRFTPEHKTLAQAMAEPMRVAVENHRRLRELKALREATEAENRSLLARLGRQDISDTIVGAGSGLKEIMERVALVAPSDTPVLILGETGTGKEVVARAIHKGSRRCEAPFVRVNCGAIPAELIDSELFGHEKGSFTGAIGQRQGWFERADRGTLFLDEVGELSPAAQVRLLRILQDGTFQRVGGQRQMHVDVRVVAATNRDLQEMVTQGTFREDLWYRIAIFPVRLPSLRERIEDIPALAGHFARRAAQRLDMPPLEPTPADIELLSAYRWPGNVRELASVMERAAILGNGRTLEVSKALGINAQPRGPRQPDTTTGEEFATLDEAMAGHIRSALQRTHGRIEGPLGAAKLLRINPHTLRARMRKLGIAWDAYRREWERSDLQAPSPTD